MAVVCGHIDVKKLVNQDMSTHIIIDLQLHMKKKSHTNYTYFIIRIHILGHAVLCTSVPK